MTRWTDEFLETGMVVIEDALSPDFCESVVDRRLSELGIVESDPNTYPVGWQNTTVTTAYPLLDVAPAAAEALFELVGPPEKLKFYDLPDNLIFNFPDDPELWWPPDQKDDPSAGWHKDGDWFRHFLDSPEQAMLGIIFWRDVTDLQGPTYVLSDSIPPIARLLADHPEGLQPPLPYRPIIEQSKRPISLTGRQGTIVWAHPFLVHSKSINATDQLRIISNTSVMLRDPLQFIEGNRTPLERSVLNALEVPALNWTITGPRGRVVSERERRWRESRAQAG